MAARCFLKDFLFIPSKYIFFLIIHLFRIWQNFLSATVIYLISFPFFYYFFFSSPTSCSLIFMMISLNIGRNTSTSRAQNALKSFFKTLHICMTYYVTIFLLLPFQSIMIYIKTCVAEAFKTTAKNTIKITQAIYSCVNVAIIGSHTITFETASSAGTFECHKWRHSLRIESFSIVKIFAIQWW